MTDQKIYENVEVKEKDSEVEITASISQENLTPFKEKALERLAKTTDLPGFRPGKVPANVIKDRVSEQELLQYAAEDALKIAYPEIVAEKALRVIGRPEISIMKLAVGNPFEFKIKVALAPEVTLPDYKKIAATTYAVTEDVVVEEAEVEKVLKDIRKTRTQVERAKEAEAKDDPSTSSGQGALPKVDPNEEIKDEDLLELTDEFVAQLGQFKSVKDFEDQVRDNLKKEKESRNREKKRVELGEELIKGAKMTLPRILIDSELQKMDAQFKEDVARMGMEYDEYLKKISKTEEALKKEWEEPAEKRAKLQVILNKIAVEEKIEAGKDEVLAQVNQLLEHYKDADPENVRIYVETILTNEKVFGFLEEQRN